MMSYEILIRESHLDTFGHVNNATYLQIFEEARWEVITRNGYGFKEVHNYQQGPIILEANLKFLKELKLREKIQVTVQVESYESKIGVLKQNMIRSDGSIACELTMRFGLFDMKQRKLIEPTPAWSQALGL